jgi:splicing factor 3B subunit 2
MASTTAINGDLKKPIKSKNQLRRLKQKQKKSQPQVRVTPSSLSFFLIFVIQNGRETTEDVKMEDSSVGLNVEYVFEQLDTNTSALEAFSDVFARFQLPPEDSSVRSPVFRWSCLADPHTGPE